MTDVLTETSTQKKLKFKLFITNTGTYDMGKDSKDQKGLLKEYSDSLARLGTDLRDIGFSYKIIVKTSKEYWQKRIEDFKGYSKKGQEYYDQVYTMMSMVDKNEAQMFLLHISKFRQQSAALLEIMEKIYENPTIIDRKDKQQSKWSKDVNDQLTKCSEDSLRHEKKMNTLFREFYEEHLKGVLE